MKLVFHFLVFLAIGIFASAENLDESVQLQQDDFDEVESIVEMEDDDSKKESFFSQLEDIFFDSKQFEYQPYMAYSAGFQMAKSVQNVIPQKPNEIKMCQMITAQRAVRNLILMLYRLLDTMPRVEADELFESYDLKIVTPMKNIYRGFFNLTRAPSKHRVEKLATICDQHFDEKIFNNLKILLDKKNYIFYQSQLEDFESEPFKKLAYVWKQLFKHVTIMVGICDALTQDDDRFATFHQPLLETVENLVQEQRKFIRNSCFQENTTNIICDGTYWPDTIMKMLHDELIEMNENDVDVLVLGELRDKLNQKYQDLDIFTLIMIPVGKFQTQNDPNENMFHYSNRHGLHIIVYRSIPSATFIPLKDTSSVLAKVNFEPPGTVGLFETNPLCLNSNSYYKFYRIVENKCGNEKLFCLVSGGPGVTVATTNAHIFIKKFKVSCNFFLKESVYLIVGLKPDNKKNYDSVPVVNAILKEKKRLHNAIINVSDEEE